MEPEFITYQKFNDVALANELAEILTEHNIDYFIDEEAFRFDPSLVMSNAQKEYAVKIKSEDFERVNQLLKENEAKNIEGVEKDYYLFSFTDDELIEVIAKADEWNAFDNVLARKILADRGKIFSEQEITAINEQRLEELKAPEKPQTTWVIIGYIIALTSIFMPLFICIIGIFIGWHLFNFKKTLPDGERVFEYADNDRRHGKRIFYLSIAMIPVNIITLVVYNVYFRNY
ncbi:MAG TPA: hypothetical protein VGN20_20925 [Mucilaginibacter sp.]|jgi:hypothetical protein